jgi:hypothetical protein
LSFPFADFIDIPGTFSFAVFGAITAMEKRLDDALGLGFFTIIGIHKGLLHHLNPGACVALGTMTGCWWYYLFPACQYFSSGRSSGCHFHHFDICYPDARHTIQVAFAGLVSIKITMNTFCLYKKT